MKQKFKSSADIKKHETKLVEQLQDVLWDYERALKDVAYYKRVYGPEGPSEENSWRTFGNLVARSANSNMTDGERSSFYGDLRMSDAEFSASLPMGKPAEMREKLAKDVATLVRHINEVNGGSARMLNNVKGTPAHRKLNKVFGAATNYFASGDKSEDGLFNALLPLTHREREFSALKL